MVEQLAAEYGASVRIIIDNGRVSQEFQATSMLPSCGPASLAVVQPMLPPCGPTSPAETLVQPMLPACESGCDRASLAVCERHREEESQTTSLSAGIHQQSSARRTAEPFHVLWKDHLTPTTAESKQ